MPPMNDTAERQRGYLTTWHPRGYGWIRPDGSHTRDLFVHTTQLVDQNDVPEPGDRVEFRVIYTVRGPAAGHVARIRPRGYVPLTWHSGGDAV